MAKLLNQYNTEIVNGSKVESSHIKQFADALTGAEAYDVAISGSLVINGLEIIGGQLSSGTNYITVLGNKTPEENSTELISAYNIAKTMPRYLGNSFKPDRLSDNIITVYKGQTFDDSYAEGPGAYAQATNTIINGPANSLTVSSITEREARSVRTKVIIAPGYYTFSAPQEMLATNIDLQSLTGNVDVFITNSATIANAYASGISVINPENNSQYYMISNITTTGTYDQLNMNTDFLTGNSIIEKKYLLNDNEVMSLYNDSSLEAATPENRGITIGTLGHGMPTLIKGDYIFLSDYYNGNSDGVHIYEIQQFETNADALIAANGRGGMLYTDNQGYLKITYNNVT